MKFFDDWRIRRDIWDADDDRRRSERYSRSESLAWGRPSPSFNDGWQSTYGGGVRRERLYQTASSRVAGGLAEPPYTDPFREKQYERPDWRDEMRFDYGRQDAPWSDEARFDYSSATAEARSRIAGARNFRGQGPKDYRRGDERIREAACECLLEDHWIDASDIEVSASDGIVTLSGAVDSRDNKWRAETLVSRIFGVTDVSNRLRVARRPRSDEQRNLRTFDPKLESVRGNQESRH